MPWLVLLPLGLVALMLVGLILLPRLIGFRAQRLTAFAGRGPVFDPRQHLNGAILCEGVIYGPFGRVSSRFVARMQGRWTGNQALLTEAFTYDDGTTQDRAWHLTLTPDGLLQAAAEDLVGAGQGRAQGPACRMRYRIRLRPEAGGHVLDVTDWMYLMPNGTIMNRSQFCKFGIKVAELVATMRPVPQ